MSVQQKNATAAMWPCAKTPLAHITALVKKDMLETDEAAQVRRRSECHLFFTSTRNCILSLKTITVKLIPSYWLAQECKIRFTSKFDMQCEVSSSNPSICVTFSSGVPNLNFRKISVLKTT